MKTPRRTRRALLGLATAVSMTLLLLTTALAGVSEVTGGSGVTVETTVRNNYTDIKREMLFQLKDGENTFPNAGSFVGDGSADQQGTMSVKFDKLAAAVEIAYTVTEDTVVMTVTNYGDLPDGVYDRPLAEDKTLMRTKYTGSKLTYTGTTYEDEGTSGGSGKVTMHEIRDDYYERTHVYTAFTLTVSGNASGGTGSGGSGSGGSGSGSSGSGSSGTGLSGADGGYSSPKTFDAGVALYAAAAVLSGSGAAVLRRKRR